MVMSLLATAARAPGGCFPLLQAVIPQKSSRTMHRRCGRARVNKVEFSLHPSPVKSA